MTILVIDDNVELAENIQEILEGEGGDVEIASGGPEGLRRLEERRFELVITDMRMPDMSGLDVIREVKRRWPKTPVVVMTACTRDEILAEAQGEGALGVIAKPIDFEVLVQFIERIAAADKSILVVEDDPALRTNLLEILQEIDGVVPYFANTCAAARQLAEELRPAGVVLDVRLPDGDGVVLAAELRKIVGPDLPVILVTGYASELRNHLNEVLVMPGIHLIEKPFAPRHLIDLVSAVTEPQAAV